MEIAKIIIEQLGGIHFRMLTGATRFLCGDTWLMFSLPSDLTNNGIDAVKVTLTPADVYTVEVLVRGVVIETIEDVYCDQIRDLFEKVTGLYTSLMPRTKVHHFVDKKA